MKVLKKLTTAAVLAAVCTSTLAGCGSSSTVNGGADTTAAKTEQTEKVKEESGDSRRSTVFRLFKLLVKLELYRTSG